MYVCMYVYVCVNNYLNNVISVSIERMILYKKYSSLFSLQCAYMWYKARSMGRPVRIEHTNNGLLILLANHSTKWGTLVIYWA